eukprot:6183576-Pleurochrysis_carterae.AAC.1
MRQCGVEAKAEACTDVSECRAVDRSSARRAPAPVPTPSRRSAPKSPRARESCADAPRCGPEHPNGKRKKRKQKRMHTRNSLQHTVRSRA